MAESWQSRAKRYAKLEFNKNELLTIIGLQLADKAMDIATFGQVSKLQGKALYNLVIPTVTRGGAIAGRAALGTARVLGSSAVQGTIGAATPLVQSAAFPYAAGAALGYGALQTTPGEQLLEMADERGRMDRIRFEQALTDISVGVKKKKSKFNTAVSKGMKAVKASTSYGKKGVINAPKKAFAAVTKIASKINKAKKDKRKFPKAPKAPNAKKIYKSILQVLK
jgi:hypothetical protein